MHILLIPHCKSQIPWHIKGYNSKLTLECLMLLAIEEQNQAIWWQESALYFWDFWTKYIRHSSWKAEKLFACVWISALPLSEATKFKRILPFSSNSGPSMWLQRHSNSYQQQSFDLWNLSTVSKGWHMMGSESQGKNISLSCCFREIYPVKGINHWCWETAGWSCAWPHQNHLQCGVSWHMNRSVGWPAKHTPKCTSEPLSEGLWHDRRAWWWPASSFADCEKRNSRNMIKTGKWRYIGDVME